MTNPAYPFHPINTNQNVGPIDVGDTLESMEFPASDPDLLFQAQPINSAEGGRTVRELAALSAGYGLMGLGMVCNASCSLGGTIIGLTIGAKLSIYGGILGLVIGTVMGGIQGGYIGYKIGVHTAALEDKYGARSIAYGCIGLTIGLLIGTLGGGASGAAVGAVGTFLVPERVCSFLGATFGTVFGVSFACLGSTLMQAGKADEKEIKAWNTACKAPLLTLYNSVAGPGTTFHSRFVRPISLYFAPGSVWLAENRRFRQELPWKHIATEIKDIDLSKDWGPGILHIQKFINKKSKPINLSIVDRALDFLSSHGYIAAPLKEDRKAIKAMQRTLNQGLCVGTTMAMLARDKPHKLDNTLIKVFQILEGLSADLEELKERKVPEKISREESEKCNRYLKNITEIQNFYLDTVVIEKIEDREENTFTNKTIQRLLDKNPGSSLDIGICTPEGKKGHSILLLLEEDGKFSICDRSTGYYTYDTKEKLVEAFQTLLQRYYPACTHVEVKHKTVAPPTLDDHEMTVV